MKLLSPSILFFLITVLALQSCSTPVNQTTDTKASTETIKLFNNLMELSKNHTMFGHQDDPAYGIGWHEYSPLSGKDSWADTEDTVNKTVEAIIPGGSHHDVYKQHLDRVADFLHSLKTPEGTLIPFIFRPLHENMGSWFWWGNSHCSADQYKTLFRFTVDYLKTERDIHHALYCYSPNGGFSSEEEYLQRYPGDEYVDILGFDHYSIKFNEKSGKEAVRSLEVLADMAAERKKLFAFTETGDYGLPTANWFTEHLLPIINTNEKTRGIVYVLVWRNDEHQENHFFVPYEGHAQADDFKKFREHDLILFEDDLPMKLYR